MYVIRERGLTNLDDEKKWCLYFVPTGSIFWMARPVGDKPPVDPAIRTLDEAHQLYAAATADHRARFNCEPTNLEIVGCNTT